MNEIFIYDDIGPEWMGLVGAKSVLAELGKIGKGKPVTVRINSPGGDVVEAQAIYNAFRRHEGTVTVEVDGLAASAASFIAMAGDKIRIAENAMFMIHRAWSVSVGNAADMRATADVLDKFDGIIADTYAARSKQEREKIDELLAAETWLTAAESVELGLADEIGTPMNVSASIKEGRFAKTPERFIVDRLPRDEKRQNSVRAVNEQLRIARARMGV